jgi:hypothetical protein
MPVRISNLDIFVFNTTSLSMVDLYPCFFLTQHLYSCSLQKLYPDYESQVEFSYAASCSTLGAVVQSWVSAKPGLKFHPLLWFGYICTSVNFKTLENDFY